MSGQGWSSSRVSHSPSHVSLGRRRGRRSGSAPIPKPFSTTGITEAREMPTKGQQESLSPMQRFSEDVPAMFKPRDQATWGDMSHTGWQQEEGVRVSLSSWHRTLEQSLFKLKPL